MHMSVSLSIAHTLRRLIDSTPLAIAVLARDGSFLHLNRKFLDTFGYASDEIPNLDAWWPRAYPDSSYRDKVKREWCGNLLTFGQSEELPPYECNVTCRDGSLRTVQWRATHLGPCILALATDLTEHVRDTAALIASEERYRLLLETAPEALFVFDVDDDRFVECNEAAERLFDLPRAALLQADPWQLSPPTQPDGRPSRELGETFLARALAGETPVFEWQFRDSSGQGLLTEIRLLRLPDSTGRRLVRGSIVDIAARKRSEDTLRENEERFRLLVENSTELVAQIDRNGIIIYASPNHLAITGRAPDEMVGRSVFEFVHPDDVPILLKAFQSASEQLTRVFRYRFKDGSWHWLESGGRRFRTSTGEEMAAVISRDITQRVAADEARKQLEAQLREAQKMEAIGTLAGGIAHDFNNILTGLFGNLQMAIEELPPEHRVHPLLTESYKACVRARDLVAKILTFSRRREQPKAAHWLGPIIREAAGLLRASLPTTIEIRTELPGTDLPVLCDPVQIHQVIMNLGTNAAHAMQRNGGVLTIRVEGTASDDSLPSANPWMASTRLTRLEISDTGCGMDESIRQRIFEPFFTTKPIGEGTGLGLAVVHGIVKGHNGLIAVQSTAGAGTTFRIWLPATDQPLPTPAAAPAQLARGRGERVLFVDDEIAVCEVGRHILSNLGYDVISFNDAQRAVQAFQRAPQNFDAVISDLTMPGLTGIQLIAQLHALRPDIAVLLTTGYMRAADVEEARAVGVRHFLEKPFTLEALAEGVRRALDDR